ncbi:hypothetical protein Lalb_Chr03g0034611 [Lupinus albus]|uniref:Uncharacterized protein n=1 Tax=Lupinus albus TaxID=3870 RepID=A0A6A4QUR6_LUPAL|nr:hypothetical protein Lalb_Chr03g0034611 [Lupinus albus]
MVSELINSTYSMRKDMIETCITSTSNKDDPHDKTIDQTCRIINCPSHVNKCLCSLCHVSLFCNCTID